MSEGYRINFAVPADYDLDAVVKQIPTVKMLGDGRAPFDLELDAKGIVLRFHDPDEVTTDRILKIVLDQLLADVGSVKLRKL